MEDSAWPFPAGQAPVANTVLIYGPGDTPHTWLPDEVDMQGAQYRLPGFVRSDPLNASYVQDCNAMISWLNSIGAPKGIALFWDMETAIAPGYLSAVGYIMNLEGYKVLPYGSLDYVWQNPHLDGLFTSHPTSVPHFCTPGICGGGLNANALITQYLFAGSYDMSLIAPGVPLWDTHTTPPPPPTEEIDMIIIRRPDGACSTTDGAHKAPVTDTTSLAAYEAAGIKLVNVTEADYDAIPSAT